MKCVLRILLFLLLPVTVIAQQYDYAKLMGGVGGNAYSQGVVSDDVGNVYMKGTFSGSQQIGSAVYRTTGTDAYICKNDPSGNLLWYKNVGFDNAEDGSWQGGDIAIDNANNIYITGSFGGVQTIEGTTLTSNGSDDIYLIKYDQNGNFQWAKSLGTPGLDGGHAIAVDISQNVYVGGFLRSGNNIVFNGNTIFIGGLQGAEFEAKYNSDGTENWINIGTGSGGSDSIDDLDFSDASNNLFAVGDDGGDVFYKSVNANTGVDNWTQNASISTGSGEALGVDIFETNMYMTGQYRNDDVSFPGSLAPMTLTNLSGRDIFLVRIDTASGLHNGWGSNYSGTGNEAANDISLDPVTGEVYITGYYESNDLFIMPTAPLPQPLQRSPFIAQFNSSGVPVAAREIATGGSDEGTGVNFNAATNSIFTTGVYYDFGFFDIKQTIQKNYTFYIANNKVGSLAFNWANTPPKGEIVVQHMVVDNNDNLFIGGYFDGTVNVLGTTIISSEITTDPTLPRNDLFIAKMNPDESLDWIVVAGGLDADTLVDITYDGQGSVYLNTRFTNVATIAGVVPDVMGKVIVKLDQGGNLIYAYQFDLPPNSDITAIQGDNDIGADTLYMGGYYNGVANFQGTSTNSSNLTDVFLVALDGFGSVIPSQVTDHGGETDERITDMNKLPGGQLHITGWSNSPNNLAFDGLDLPIGAANGTDIFVVRFDDTLFENGGFNDGGPEDQFSDLIALDGLGNIVISGELLNEGTFSGSLLSFDNTYNSYFIASYSDPFGAFNHAIEIYEPFGGGTNGSLTDLVADATGNVFLAGIMRSEDLFFDGATSISTTGETDGFLAKYDVSGNLDFAEPYGGDYVIGAEAFEGYDYGLAMAVNLSDNLWYSGTLAIKSETFGPFTLQPASSESPGEFAGMDSYLLRLGSGVAAPPNPKVYWTEETGNQINRSNLDGSSFDQYYSGFSIFPQGLALDTLNDKIYWSDTNGKVKRGDIGASTIENIETLVDKSFSSQRRNGGVAVDVPNNKLYWVESWNDEIWRSNLDGTSPQLIVNVGSPVDIAVDGTNNKIYYTAGQELIMNNTDGSAPVSIYSSSWPQYGLDLVLATGRIFWIEDDEGIFTVHSADLDGNNRNTEGATGNFLIDVAVDHINNKLYVTDDSQPGIGVIDGSFSYIQTTPNVSNPAFIVLDIPMAGPPACASPPTANAGPDVDFCETDNRTIFGAIGGGATSVTWTTGGDGTFTAATSVAPSYSPGPNDIANGSVILTITTDDPDGAGSCIAAADDMIITIERISLMDAGPDQTVCQGDPMQLSGTIIGDPVPISWFLNSADGTFDDENILTPVYTPGPNDIINGSFTLLLESSPPVCVEESDNITITISQPITAVNQTASLNVTETTLIDVTNGATIGAGDVITTTLLTQPQKGTTLLNGDGSISYTALTGTVGDDTFDYEIRNQCDLFSTAQITITIINVPPVVNVPPSTIIAGGVLIRNILSDISDDNGNIDLSSLRITIQPQSGAPASLDASGNLTVDYTGLKFAGTDQLAIEICDLDGLCTTQVIFIEVEPPGVIVYNAVSPNGDEKHDYLEIENAEFFLDNQVKIMNRWGDLVFEIAGYNNDTKKFTGVANKNGSGELPSGTYYYNIVLGDGSKDLNGFFTLRR